MVNKKLVYKFTVYSLQVVSRQSLPFVMLSATKHLLRFFASLRMTAMSGVALSLSKGAARGKAPA